MPFEVTTSAFSNAEEMYQRIGEVLAEVHLRRMTLRRRVMRLYLSPDENDHETVMKRDWSLRRENNKIVFVGDARALRVWSGLAGDMGQALDNIHQLHTFCAKYLGLEACSSLKDPYEKHLSSNTDVAKTTLRKLSEDWRKIFSRTAWSLERKVSSLYKGGILQAIGEIMEELHISNKFFIADDLFRTVLNHVDNSGHFKARLPEDPQLPESACLESRGILRGLGAIVSCGSTQRHERGTPVKADNDNLTFLVGAEQNIKMLHELSVKLKVEFSTLHNPYLCSSSALDFHGERALSDSYDSLLDHLATAWEIMKKPRAPVHFDAGESELRSLRKHCAIFFAARKEGTRTTHIASLAGTPLSRRMSFEDMNMMMCRIAGAHADGMVMKGVNPKIFVRLHHDIKVSNPLVVRTRLKGSDFLIEAKKNLADFFDLYTRWRVWQPAEAACEVVNPYRSILGIGRTTLWDLAAYFTKLDIKSVEVRVKDGARETRFAALTKLVARVHAKGSCVNESDLHKFLSSRKQTSFIFVQGVLFKKPVIKYSSEDVLLCTDELMWKNAISCMAILLRNASSLSIPLHSIPNPYEKLPSYSKVMMNELAKTWNTTKETYASRGTKIGVDLVTSHVEDVTKKKQLNAK